MTTAPDDRQAGFTFIEVLAALVVTILIVTTVLPFATRLATRWWLGAARIEGADAVMQAVARLSGDLAQAVPYGLPGGDTSALAFRGDETSLTFVCPTIGQPGAAGLDIVRYDIRATGAGAALVRRSRAFDAAAFAAGDLGGAAPSTLMAGPYRFRVSYVADDGSRQGVWTPSDHLPRRVDLGIALDARGGARPPVPLVPIPMTIASRQSPVSAAGAEP